VTVHQLGSPTPKVGDCRVAHRIEGRHRVVRFTASLSAVALLIVATLVLSSPGSATSRDVPLAAQDVAAKASPSSGPGYWLVTSTGRVYAYGGATNYGGMAGQRLNKAIVGISSTPDGKGYWLFSGDGGVFAFGDAAFYGSQGATGTSSQVVAGSSVQQGGTGGSPGPTGPAGPTGATGPAGLPGLIGLLGLTGPAGIPGATGLTGANGTIGPAGPPGAAGGTGPTGATGPAGLLGPMGLLGPTGATGPAGLPGATGATGLTGATGVAGPTGATGATGSVGATGPQGPPGQPDYGYIYNLGAQTVAMEGAVLFDSNGPLSGFTHTTGSASITVGSTSTYLVDFSISGTQPSQFSLFDNGSPVAGATYGSGAGTQQDGGQVIVSLAAGDVLTLVNHSSASAIGLASNIGGTQANVNASLVIEELG
jgi:hypothetical protein